MGLVEGKVALITGAGRGQGRAHAVRLAEEGADIIAVDICADIAEVPYPLATEEDLAETVQLVEKTGRRALPYRADVRRFTELREAVAAGIGEFGHLDVVSANAGVAAIEDGLSEDGIAGAWEAVIAVNLTGVWNTLRACSPPIVEQGQGGSMIITSSTAGLRGTYFGNDAYGAAKHGVVGLMRQFAIHLAKDQIRVNTIHPTGVQTGMVSNEKMLKHLMETYESSPFTSTNLLPIQVLQPRDVSDTVVFLASDLSRYITGVTLPVDAGNTAH